MSSEESAVVSERSGPEILVRKEIGTKAEIVVICGDITKIQTEGICISSNNYLHMGSGSAGAMRKAGGLLGIEESNRVITELKQAVLARSMPNVQLVMLRDSQTLRVYAVQAEALRKLLEQPIDSETHLHQAFSPGSVVTASTYLVGSRENMPEEFMHLITTRYTPAFVDQTGMWKLEAQGETIVSEVVASALTRALELSQSTAKASLSVPLIGVNKDKFTVEESARLVVDVIKNAEPEFNTSLTIQLVEFDRAKAIAAAKFVANLG